MTTSLRPRVLAGTAAAGLLLALAAAAPSASAGGSSDLPGPTAAPGAAAKPAAPGRGVQRIPGSWVVVLEPGASAAGLARAAGVTPQHTYSAALNGFAARMTDRQVAGLRHNPHVVSIEPDGVVEGDAVQYTGTNGQPWGLDRVDQRTGLSRSYRYAGTGAGVTAYIIDSGISTAHPDFGGRAVDVYDAFGGNGQDCHGHGTHVAGTVGGAVHGVAKSVRLRGVKVLGCDNKGSYSGIIAGIDWVARNATRPAVANLSLGGPYYGPLNTAVTNLTRSGVFAAVAAGNENADACTRSPASAAGTMTVASMDWYDRKASDSNWGACVDLYAPGVNVQSDRLGGGTAVMSGTSMATPHVTGMAALVKGDYGDVASPDLVSYLLSYATTGAVGGNVTGTPNRLLFQAGW